MATSFTSANLIAPTYASRGGATGLVYTCPSLTQAIVFSGTIANIDDTNMLDHAVTLEILKIDGTTYKPTLHKLVIPYGSSLIIPKMSLITGEKIYVSASLANVLHLNISIVEKT